MLLALASKNLSCMSVRIRRMLVRTRLYYTAVSGLIGGNTVPAIPDIVHKLVEKARR